MGLKEVLKQLGYTDEQISAITAEMQKNNLTVTAGTEDAGNAETKKLQTELAALKAENEALRETQKKGGDTSKEDNGTKKDQGSNASEVAAEVKKLREQMEAERIRAAAVLELTKAHAQDVDYMMYLAEKDGSLKGLKIGEDGNVTGASELVDMLKKAHAAQFAAESGSGTFVRTGIKKLEGQKGQETEPATLEEAIAQKYAEEEKGGQEG
ncbi:MAG: hypothetical protein HDR21_12145 [Lachnospiraceae bacterium]|nr:hypothetical protein [Lachnospiraceae bacterium]